MALEPHKLCHRVVEWWSWDEIALRLPQFSSFNSKHVKDLQNFLRHEIFINLSGVQKQELGKSAFYLSKGGFLLAYA
jgi:hypothetical protein